MTAQPRPLYALPCIGWAAWRLLREREQGYPARVEAGSMTQEAADASLATSRAIVAQWRWALDPRLPPLPESFGADEAEMMEQVAQTLAWERKRADARPADLLLRERADLAASLAWYQHAPPGAYSRIVVEMMADRRSRVRWFVPDPTVDARYYRDLGLPLAAESEMG